MFSLWFLPPAFMACLSSAETHSHTSALGCAAYSKANPARINVVSVENDLAENRPFSHFFGATTIDFVIGNSKTKRNLDQGQTGKIDQVNREAYLQRTVSTRGSLLLVLLPRSGLAGAEI